MSSKSPSLAADTLVLHGGAFRHDPTTSATAVPNYQSTSFDFPDTATAVKIVNFEQIAFTYSRVGNPTVDALEQRLAALEGGAAARGAASGQAATALAVLTLVEAGDNIVSSPDLRPLLPRALEAVWNRGALCRSVRSREFPPRNRRPHPPLFRRVAAQPKALRLSHRGGRRHRPAARHPADYRQHCRAARDQAFRPWGGGRRLFGDQIHRRPRHDDRRRHRRQRQISLGRFSRAPALDPPAGPGLREPQLPSIGGALRSDRLRAARPSRASARSGPEPRPAERVPVAPGPRNAAAAHPAPFRQRRQGCELPRRASQGR